VVMIWFALPIIALLILISKLKTKPRGVYMDIKSLIREANKIGGWSGDKPPTEFGEFLGVYLGRDPRSDIPRTVMTLEEFARIVKQTTGSSNKVITQSIIAIAIREQLIQGKLIFPDNNPFGFNAWRGGWGSIKHLINGIFLAKDRQGWKWFLSFPSLQHAIKAMDIVLRKKEFHTIKMPEDFANLYIRRWWSPTKDENKLKEIIRRETPNLASIWRRAGKYVG